MKCKVYCSYGVLAHEKQKFFSLTPASDISETVTVYLPDELVTGENVTGEPLLSLDGLTYTLSEVLSNSGDRPVIRWYDGAKDHYRYIDSDPEIKALAERIRNADTWDMEDLAALCEAADMTAEWEAADGETFEAVAFAAAEKLGVEIV